ncbi:FAD-binding oxidoreductase [Arsenicicoccus piscis]|uniref:Oxidoreductase n=1 Tax=Arsenicicoccus piscis TaxID=673954 RepID=A0ABQ6HKA7_9MICO|nr:FAD-binding and (Fe-S)-binding domain-containing protein [Arsenicicoccus piscis]MCH8627226.1 FAD-binding oxidoreductase [Arsenicicoccus piscis]GMA18796.1 oxidoreductase [Arsenicicoccus piscis]
MIAAPDLAHELARAGLSDVRTDELTRAMYSSDASLYRIPPLVVAAPMHPDEIAAALEVCRSTGVPLTARGAGTSIAGNAVGPGLVLDLSRHLGRVLEIDREARTAVVQPGTVHATLQRAALTQGLRFGPDPSTHTRCTIAGMIGNNACGSRALAYGRTSDNVHAMKALMGTGQELRLETGIDGGTPSVVGADDQLRRLRHVVDGGLASIRTELGRFTRQVSGYALEHLLPERGFDVGRMLIGSEGTLAIVTEATVRLVTDPGHALLTVFGLDDIAAAADVAPHLARPGVTAAEGMDERITTILESRRGPGAVPALPDGRAWLLVETVGADADEARAVADELIREVPARAVRVVTDRREAAALWKIREDGAGLASESPAGKPAHAGWEDAAVPPARLGAYLRDLDSLLVDRGLTGVPYGHFGEGCVHMRLDFDLDQPGGTGRFNEFLHAAADLVARYGGSLSGEHGDGRARSELLPRIYSPATMELFGAVKHVFDPDDLLNRGVLVDPDPAAARVRVATRERVSDGLGFSYPADEGDFSLAVHRCTGVGKCRAAGTSTTVMCPSYQATREEKDSTRGRARVLQEMLHEGTSLNRWRATEVMDALDLCLSCKGCGSDCPTGIDMATYKSEVLHQAYRKKVRPRSHYSLGQLPRWTRIASRVPMLANLALTIPGVKDVALAAAGVDARRGLPRFANQTFREWFSDSETPVLDRAGGGKPIVVFVDSFSDAFDPEVGQATVDVLRAAGYAPTITGRSVCCGLTWITTGQLDSAKRILTKSVAELDVFARQGIPIVGLEPSCTAVLRHDAVSLLGTEAAQRVADATVTLAELLTRDPDYTPPDLTGVEVVAQPHCHHHAVMSWAADQQLLERAGATVTRIGGCCGLAGNFGVEKGHYEVSVAVAETQLLPAVRAAAPDAVVLADGFSCRTQLDDLAPRGGVHLAQLLASRQRVRGA